jgi:pimeloyl-ACP methyl ester carboxylesterase
MILAIYVVGGLLLAVSVLWLVGAARAGHFIRDKGAVAFSAGEDGVEAFSRNKKLADVGPWRVAYIDEGKGDVVVLLHGCPFQSYEYSRVIPSLARHYRVIAPDLLGLGDTIVRLDDDYRLPNQVKMVLGLMDHLEIERALFVGHDHGGAIIEIMMKTNPERLRAVVLTNAEAYDQWPSEPERLDVELVVNAATTPFLRLLLGIRAVQRWIYRIAVQNREVLTDEVLAAFTRPNMATPARWLRLRRFLSWQLDREHNMETMHAVDGLRQFRRPTLILWGKNDTNFGPAIAERLARDIPGAVGIQWMEHSAHLPMLEEPDAYAAAVERFFETAP